MIDTLEEEMHWNPGEMVKFIPVENCHWLFFQFQQELEMFSFLFKTTRLYLLMFIPHTLVNLPGSDCYAMNITVQCGDTQHRQSLSARSVLYGRAFPFISLTSGMFWLQLLPLTASSLLTIDSKISNIIVVIHYSEKKLNPTQWNNKLLLSTVNLKEEVWLSRPLRKPVSLYRGIHSLTNPV